jgi:hypothetical protein
MTLTLWNLTCLNPELDESRISMVYKFFLKNPTVIHLMKLYHVVIEPRNYDHHHENLLLGCVLASSVHILTAYFNIILKSMPEFACTSCCLELLILSHSVQGWCGLHVWRQVSSPAQTSHPIEGEWMSRMPSYSQCSSPTYIWDTLGPTEVISVCCCWWIWSFWLAAGLCPGSFWCECIH